jgi:uncharacterized protein (TIGR04255 family)
MAEAARQYKKPPILEATFEARFEPSEKWGLPALGRLFENLQEDYPGEPKQIAAGNIEMVPTAQGSLPSLTLNPMAPVYEFSSPANGRLVRASREILSVHIAPPYPGWLIFRELIADAFEAYRDIAQPVSINRIGIRYVNRIEFPGPAIELSDYFTIPTQELSNIGFKLGAFFIRFEGARPDESLRMVQTFASTPAQTPTIILDIDVIEEETHKPLQSRDEFLDHADSIRAIEREIFEASITDNLRRMFDDE